MDSQSFTLFHVAISVIAIATGLVVVYGMLNAQRMAGLTALFLVTTILTSVTGFFFQRDHLLPSHIVGIISLVILAVTVAAMYARHLLGGWRVVYVIGAVMALYLNVFVLVVQSFLKVPSLHVLAPHGSEPPFAIAQGAVLIMFVVLGFLAARRFHPAAA